MKNLLSLKDVFNIGFIYFELKMDNIKNEWYKDS